MTREPTPRHEPEVIAAEARRNWHGDREKVRTTSVSSMSMDGIALSSRYDKAHEYDTMAAMVETLAINLRPSVRSIFCDSKAPASYAVELRRCTQEDASAIGRQLEHACFERDGGHNGLLLTNHDGLMLFVEPSWAGD